MASVDDREIAEFIQCENHFEPQSRQNRRVKRTVQELVVWGGNVWNGGEHALSEMVDASSCCLRSLVYCPNGTKGGCLVRPKYHQSDRQGKETFPSLTDLTIRLVPCLIPQDYGWITPGLRRLRLVVPTQGATGSLREEEIIRSRLRLQESLCKWLKRGPDTYPEILLNDCPHLESIQVVFASTSKEDRTEIEWISLLPPKRIPWNIHRLMLLAVLKPEGSGSPSIACLDIHLVDAILAFLGRPAWILQEKQMSQTDAEELGLPPDLMRMTRIDLDEFH